MHYEIELDQSVRSLVDPNLPDIFESFRQHLCIHSRQVDDLYIDHMTSVEMALDAKSLSARQGHTLQCHQDPTQHYNSFTNIHYTLLPGSEDILVLNILDIPTVHLADSLQKL